MGSFWLKLVGTTEEPLSGAYGKKHVGFPRRPQKVRPGDQMVLYAVGGTKHVFALAEVTSNVYEGGEYKRFPFLVKIRYILNLPISAGVHIDDISTSKRDLKRSIRRSYIRLSREEYEKAASKLLAERDGAT